MVVVLFQRGHHKWRKTFFWLWKREKLIQQKSFFQNRTYAKIAELARPRANSDTRGRVSLLKMNGFV